MSGGRRIWVLNVAEKPSVAKSVAEILSRRGGGMRSREGRSRFNRVFEFEYAIDSCDPADLYHAPIRKYVPEDKLDLKRTLEEEARRCQWLVLWLDCDREGENIAFEVVDVCTSVNSHLNIWRARFSALIDREIHAAVQNLVRPNKLFADAVDARQEIDLRIGASFTRFQTMLLRDTFVLDFAGDDRSIVLSYGPCQFPTLGFIVERYWEIQAHEPEEFWTINCSHTSEEGTATFSWMRGHLFDYTCAVIVYEMCVEEPMATVTDVKHKEKLKYPPHPLSTVELQKRASRYFRMSSEHTMKVAEELYQAGYISYPRTETDGFSVNTDLQAIVHEQVAHPTWGSYAQQLLDPEVRLWRNPSNGGHDDKAHPPIHPTKFSVGEPGWTEDHKRLYEFVVRHFLACVSQPAVGAGTTVEIDIAGERFSATGLAIIARNYLDVYRFESWGGVVIPTYNIEQTFIPTTLTLDSGVTRPPPLLSESDLLSRMDKAGIGTDATMHDHIKKLLDRCYATKDTNTRFSPTKLGEALVMGYDDMGYELWKPYLRSMMEFDMKEVSTGSKSKSQVLENCLQQMKACFLDARLNKIKLLDAMEMFFERSGRSGDTQNFGAPVKPCSVCHESDMLLKRRPNGDFMVGCQRFPLVSLPLSVLQAIENIASCRNVVWLPGAISDASVTGNVCPRCTTGPVFLIQFKFRRLEIPPNYDVDHLGCVGGCDDILKELIEICGTGSRNATPMTARGQTSDPSNAAQRRSTESNPCMHCRQTGHSSNDCPFQVSRSRRAQSTNNARNGAGPILCDCGEPSALRTANTENNRGRKFYVCQSRDCDFFVWEENLENGTGQGRGAARGSSGRSSSSTPRRGGRGRARGQRGAQADGITFVSATGERVSGSCFICGDPSHFANTCPNRGR
ncbi:DNA topoisomerase 3-alpha [Phalaenopsis equestris]|uniref:DNA topoisomerase 3-alpha n=1 Tax=Phalaenopsis equestris TaxID=78828 RepID=UPI0009E23336|nr:DNA topoisomerase 3-alpha [Phalaenopsis equestris]